MTTIAHWFDSLFATSSKVLNKRMSSHALLVTGRIGVGKRQLARLEIVQRFDVRRCSGAFGLVDSAIRCEFDAKAEHIQISRVLMVKASDD